MGRRAPRNISAASSFKGVGIASVTVLKPTAHVVSFRFQCGHTHLVDPLRCFLSPSKSEGLQGCRGSHLLAARAQPARALAPIPSLLLPQLGLRFALGRTQMI